MDTLETGIDLNATISGRTWRGAGGAAILPGNS